jgi:zinc protease
VKILNESLVPRRAALISVLVAIACGGTQSASPFGPPSTAAPTPNAPVPPGKPDESFRAQEPKPGPETAYVPPKIEQATLSNGIRVLAVERHEMPIVALQVVVNRGADQARPGHASFAASLFMSGTKTRNALAISDSFEGLGAEHAEWANYDATFIRVQVLSTKLAAALEILSDVVQNATFPEAEVKRELPRRLNAILQERDDPNAQHTNAVIDALYGARHPYGVSLLGTDAEIKNLRAEDLRAYHRAHVRPDRTTIVASGDVRPADLVPLLENAFGAWKGTSRAAVKLGEPAPAAKAPRILLVDRPGATQSHVALCHVGVPRKTPDYDALVVMNTIFGGQFSSRLNLNLREAHAYTYGAGSLFDMRREAGPYRTYGAIVGESTLPAIREILAEIDRVRRDPVSDDELAAAKAYLIRRLPARFETAGATTDALAVLVAYDLPLDEYATYPARIAAVTRDQVKRVAEARLLPDKLRIVVLGDAAKVRPALESAGLGEIEVRSAAPAPAAKSAKGK